ncbi:MAG: flagellar hook-basal body complex protein [Campylobacterales bacterium]
MMRSLFSGVSGLVSHQVAMDVEGNNIANVNTVGFKQSRTNFQDSLLQTMKPSTSPQGQLGGRNALQVGSGVGVANVQRIHSQGATMATDKKTDMAINGNGFFVVSKDGGRTYNYTRAGNVSFDANGNLVNPNGLIVQGWLADKDFVVDSTMGIKNISVDLGMTVPAKPSTEIIVSANLNAGMTVEEYERQAAAATVGMDSDIGNLYNYEGEPINLKKNIDQISLDLTRQYDVGGTLVESTSTHTFIYGDGSTETDGYFTTMKELLDEINARIKDSTGIYDNKVLLTGDGKIAAARHISAIHASTSTSELLVDMLEPATYGSYQSRSFKPSVNGYIGADIVGELFDATGGALKMKTGEGIAVSVQNLGETRKFVYRAPDPDNSNSYLNNNFQDSLDVTKAGSDQGFHWMRDANGDRAFMNVGDQITFTINPTAANATVAPLTLTYGMTGEGGFQTIEDLINQVNITLRNAHENAPQLTWDSDNGTIVDAAGVIGGVALTDSTGAAPTAGSPLALLQANFDTLAGADGVASESAQFKKNDVYYFTDTQELANLYQDALDDAGDPLNFNLPLEALVSLNEEGQLVIANQGTDNFRVDVTGYSAITGEMGHNVGNQRFSQSMALGAVVSTGSSTNSQKLFAATWRTGVEVFDSSGSKHQLTINFRKVSTSNDNNEPTVWKWYVDAPAPTTFEYPTFGEIRFNLDGSVQSYSPPSITLNPNTGSSSGQIIRLDFGSGGAFGGLTSFADVSTTRYREADGYAGGFLRDISVDQTGTLIGEFSNGKNFKLAQVALATFANDEGLSAIGGNLYAEAPNSGGPTIGTAGTASRGEIAPSNLEMSNVDLSKSLTNLIIIQRGYQASSKTITTSDQLLNTLLQLKQ